MPFTLSHPLAVIPLARTRLVFSALVFGSMSPDFEYFLRLQQHRHTSHTLTGLILFCLPATLVVLWLWHEVLKRPLIELAPEAHRRRLIGLTGGFSFGPVRRFACICSSILIGAATHIAWDSFTHGWGWPVHHLSFLQTEIALPGVSPKPLYRHLQHASTLIGFLSLGGLYWMWFRRTQPVTNEPGFIRPVWRPAFYVTAGVAAFAYSAAMALQRFPLNDPENFRGFVVRTGVVAMSTFALFALSYALWFRYRFPRR